MNFGTINIKAYHGKLGEMGKLPMSYKNTACRLLLLQKQKRKDIASQQLSTAFASTEVFKKTGMQREEYRF